MVYRRLRLVVQLVAFEDKEIADNIFSGSRIGKNAAENNALNLIGAGIGGTFGAIGAVSGAFIEGERSFKNLAIAAGVGGTVGAASGATLNPIGVMGAIRTGVVAGTLGGSVEGSLTEFVTNPNATTESILNKGLKGGVSGGVGSAVAAPLSILGGGGVAASLVAGQVGLGAGVSTSIINTQYNFFDLENDGN